MDQAIFTIAATLAIISVGSIIGILFGIAIGKLYNGQSAD